jgi:uncharacterized repeat protein (TIGR02543 family)
VVTLTATPSSGYQFSGWSGDASGTSPSYTIAITSDKTIVANFSSPQRPSFQDDFSNPNSGWVVASTVEGDRRYEAGEYSLLVKSDVLLESTNAYIGQQADLAVEVDARLLAGGNAAAYGVSFRPAYSNCYAFLVSSAGTYSVGKFFQHNWYALQPWTASSYIATGGNANRLKVVCKGTTIEVYANGQKLASVNDVSLTSGYIGLVAQPSGTYAHFDNFRFFTP